MFKRFAPPVLAVFLAAVGFATGLHLPALLGTLTFSNAKGCFSFGLAQILAGASLLSCCLNAALSAGAHGLLLSCGVLSRLSLPVTAAALYGIGFKAGVCFACFAPLGFASAMWLIAFFLPILFLSCLFSCVVLERCLYHVRHRTDATDLLFLRRAAMLYACLTAYLCALLALATLLPLYGFFNTFI